MKTLFAFAFLSLATFGSAFAAVHCDTTKETELHSSEEKVIGTGRFATSDECKFAALVANEAGTGIVCAPYSDPQIKGFSIYRLADGKDLGLTVFKDVKECHLAVAYSYSQAFCSQYDNQFYFWSSKTNEPITTDGFDSLQECIVEMNKF